MTELEKQLLAALKDVLQWIDDWCETGPDMDFERIEEQADAAIAAAEDSSVDGCARAIEAPAAAIYFADSSDYLGALWTVLRSLSPDISALMEKDEHAAYQLAGVRLAAEAKGGE